MMRWTAGIAIALLLTGTARAQFRLTGEDRVVFFGDTLVEAQLFSTYVETFIRARYPDLTTRFVNCGLKDQTAADGLRRLQTDLVPLRPTVVVVCFGLFDPDRRALDATRLAEFETTYQKILEQIRALNARIVAITPPRPVPDRLRFIDVPNYDAVIARYADVIRKVAAQHDAAVVDWFRLSELLHDRLAGKPNRASRGHNLLPDPLSHAAVAAGILTHWEATPQRVDLDIDWSEGRAAVSRGRVALTRQGPRRVVLDIHELPLPWPLSGVRTADLELADWPGADLVQFILTVRNAPAGDLALVWRGKRVPLDRQQLEHGLNISHWQPIQLTTTMRDLKSHVRDKHMWRWRRVSAHPPSEPELQEAFAAYIRSIELYEEGTRQIILRLPKDFDVTLEFEATPAAPAAAPTTDGASSGQ